MDLAIVTLHPNAGKCESLTASQAVRQESLMQGDCMGEAGENRITRNTADGDFSDDDDFW
jgi:hypothetical protein